MCGFSYVSQDGSVEESFCVKFDTYSVELADLWLDLPLENGVNLLGVAYKFESPIDPRLSIILLTPASHGHNYWQRVGVCRVLAYDNGNGWDRIDRVKFVHEYGLIKELTII